MGMQTTPRRPATARVMGREAADGALGSGNPHPGKVKDRTAVGRPRLSLHPRGPCPEKGRCQLTHACDGREAGACAELLGKTRRAPAPLGQPRGPGSAPWVAGWLWVTSGTSLRFLGHRLVTAQRTRHFTCPW